MRTKKQVAGKALLGMLSVVLVLTFGLLLDGFASVAHAAEGKITSASVNVRKEATTTSDVVASVKRNEVVTVNGQVTAADGKIWYKVEIDGKNGYIRSDLMSVSEGDVPETTPDPTADVTAVNPVSAKVTGGQLIRVRSDASTTSRIVTTVENGKELTITGQATGADSKTWYQIEFTKDGSTVTGFIREDFVNPSERIIPVTENTTPEVQDPVVTPDPEVQEPVINTTKDWDTSLQDGVWYVIDNVNEKQYEITDMLQAAKTNADLFYQSQDTVKTQKIWLIILVILVLGCIGGIAYLVYRMQDENQDAFIRTVEKDTLNRRSAAPSKQRINQSVGPDRTARPTGHPGTKPAGQSGARPNGQPAPRPNGQPGTRPNGQPASKPSGQPGARPSGQPAPRPSGQPGARPNGQPASKPSDQPGARPNGQPAPRPSGQPGARPSGQPAPRPAGQPAPKPADAQNAPKNTGEGNWKSKNFMTDEDEFEFDFLNWDGSEEQK